MHIFHRIGWLAISFSSERSLQTLSFIPAVVMSQVYPDNALADDQVPQGKLDRDKEVCHLVHDAPALVLPCVPQISHLKIPLLLEDQ